MSSLIRRGALAAVVAACAGFGSVASAAANSVQVFEVGGTKIECLGSTGSKEVSPIEGATLVTVDYSECSTSGILGVTVSPASFAIDPDEAVAVEDTISFDVQGLCEITVPPQVVQSATLKGVGTSKEVVDFNLKGIESTSNNEFCAGGSSGTYVGEVEI